MNKRTLLLRKVAGLAVIAAQDLPPAKRAEILDGAALLLSPDEAELARLGAFHLRTAETLQLKLSSIMKEAGK